MLESVAMGTAQGLCEWLPFNSQACIIEAKTRFFPAVVRLNDLLAAGTALHLGTLAAGLVYFRRDIPKLLPFLGLTALLGAAALWALPLLNLPPQTAAFLRTAGHSVAAALLLTAGIYSLRNRNENSRTFPTTNNSIIAGLAQAVSLLPGLSRTGLGMSALALQGFNNQAILRLCVLMSLPLGALEMAGGSQRIWSQIPSQLPGILTSFAVGISVLHLLMLTAQKIHCGYFLLGLAGFLLAGIFTGIAG